METEDLEQRFRQRLRIAILVCGFLLPASFEIYGGYDLNFSEFILPFILWSLWEFFPFLILFGLSFKIKKNTSLLLSFILMMLIGIYVNFAVVDTISQQKSSLILVFLPIYQLVVTIPFALLIGFVVDKIKNKKMPMKVRQIETKD